VRIDAGSLANSQAKTWKMNRRETARRKWGNEQAKNGKMNRSETSKGLFRFFHPALDLNMDLDSPKNSLDSRRLGTVNRHEFS
jgi:hypothetical protein